MDRTSIPRELIIERQRQAIQEIIERQRQALQKIIDQQRMEIEEHEHRIAALKVQLENIQQYLNLFLNHPLYRVYKFFRKDRIGTATPEKNQEVQDIEAPLNEGDRLFSIADLEGADQMYRQAVYGSKYNERAVSSLVRVLQTRGEFAEAQQVARDALNQNPNSLVFLSQLASSYLSTGIFWEAERLYRKITEKWPEHIEAWLGLADLAMGDAKYPEAVSFYERVLELDPENLAALSGMAECSLHLPAVKKRIEELKKLHSQKPLIGSILTQQKSAENVQQQPGIHNSNNRILFVDQYLPIFDRNSGNHRTYQLMRLIRRSDYPLTFLARNGEYQARYKQELETLGIETIAPDRNELGAEDYTSPSLLIWWDDLMKRAEYPLAILSRYQTARTFLPLIRAYSPETKIVLDTVDVHFLREQRKANLYGGAQMHKHASKTKESELEVCRKADALIAVTDVDAAVLREELGAEKPVWVIPTIHPVEKAPVPFNERRDLVFVGNFAHPPNSDAMYYFCGQILPLIQKKLPDIYLYIVGGNSRPLLQNLLTERVILTGYVPSTKPFLHHCRLSVNPLRYGAGMKGKIGEAMAHGLPVITTTIGAEGFHMELGIHALVADTPQQFAEAVIQAYTNEVLWNKLSENGLRTIEQCYTPDAVLPTVRSLLNLV